jgi:hypothetical protein
MSTDRDPALTASIAENLAVSSRGRTDLRADLERQVFVTKYSTIPKDGAPTAAIYGIPAPLYDQLLAALTEAEAAKDEAEHDYVVTRNELEWANLRLAALVDTARGVLPEVMSAEIGDVIGAGDLPMIEQIKRLNGKAERWVAFRAVLADLAAAGTQHDERVRAGAIERASMGARLVRVSPEFLDRFGARTELGDKITAVWGEPDSYGVYEPVFTQHVDISPGELPPVMDDSELRHGDHWCDFTVRVYPELEDGSWTAEGALNARLRRRRTNDPRGPDPTGRCGRGVDGGR